MTNDGGPDIARAARDLAARLPDALSPFAELAFNYRWSWTRGGPDVFRAIDPERWIAHSENPVRLLLDAPTGVLRAAAENGELIARAESILATIRAELAQPLPLGSADNP